MFKATTLGQWSVVITIYLLDTPDYTQPKMVFLDAIFPL